jgi:hypothetical protein
MLSVSLFCRGSNLMTLLLAAVLLLAQGTNAAPAPLDLTLRGAVTDVSRALIPGVVVSLRSQAGILWISTNESGEYSFQGLKPGTYQLQVDLPGFSRRVQAVELSVSTTLNLTMEVAPTTWSGVSVDTTSLPEPIPEPIPIQYLSSVKDVPPWLASYRWNRTSGSGPPVGWIPKQPTDIGRYSMEVLNAGSVSDVAAYYREVMRRHGLTIEEETSQTESSYSFRATTKDRTHEVNLKVLRLPGRGTVVQLTDTYTLPKN